MKCYDRGEGRGRLHVYLNHSLQCQCGRGPDRAVERMR
jgi:hypothetical protein